MATPRKTIVKKPSKRSSAKKAIKGTEGVAALEKRIAELESQTAKTNEAYGEMLAACTNFAIQKDAMLGQILKALYIIGIGPDQIQAKCQQMFQKKVRAV